METNDHAEVEALDHDESESMDHEEVQARKVVVLWSRAKLEAAAKERKAGKAHKAARR